MTRKKQSTAALAFTLAATVTASLSTIAQPVTNKGWTEQSTSLDFYIEVPMIDNKASESVDGDRTITAEAIINAIRYAGNHPEIRHVVFKMDTLGGSIKHAETIKDTIEALHQNTEFHIVVQNAIATGILTAFSCDTIFMCEAGTIGGAASSDQAGDTAADDTPRLVSQLQRTAQRNGYPPQLIEPMMLKESELHYWIDSKGKKVLSNQPPADESAVEGYRLLDRNDTVLSLSTKDAIDIGIAKPIEAFDATTVGNKIGVLNWTLGNRYVQIADEIGSVSNTTRALEDEWAQKQLGQPQFEVTDANRNDPDIKQMVKSRKQHAAVVDALGTINEALRELPNVHPERHVYLTGPDETTIVADPEQWTKDAQLARALVGKLSGGYVKLASAYRDLGEDTSSLEEIVNPIRSITAHITWIASKGNAAYWNSKEE